MKKEHASLRELSEQIRHQEVLLRAGGNHERQKGLGRLTVRDRLHHLLDHPGRFFELGLWAAYGMYKEWGEFPAAGVVTGIGEVSGRMCMIIANDASVKAGSLVPQSVKKVLRAQRIAYQCRLPILYLVDSSGVFLPLQDEIFPDEDDFGRIFRNNAVLSACGIPQIAAIMGSCVAGGGYLPVLCDKLLMTEGSGLYLAAPALVKAAIGQVVDSEELGGATMHAEISGTVDFKEPNDEACLKRLRSLVSFLAEDPKDHGTDTFVERDPQFIYELISGDGSKSYQMLDLLACVVDKGSLEEYKSDYGKTLITAYARIGGYPVGIVANQRKQTHAGKGEMEIGGVVYADSADKAARFVMDCNQDKIPLIFFQDVAGFMVGKEAEQSGIIRSGAKLVNAISNSVVPKITVIVGNSFGAGNYALCGKAYDPDFILAWPNAKYAVMGAEQAAETMMMVRKNKIENPEEFEKERARLIQRYSEQTDIRYGAARGWIDAIIEPHATRDILIELIPLVNRNPDKKASFHTGVLQV